MCNKSWQMQTFCQGISDHFVCAKGDKFNNLALVDIRNATGNYLFIKCFPIQSVKSVILAKTSDSD